MFDFTETEFSATLCPETELSFPKLNSRRTASSYQRLKRIFDISVSLALVVPLFVVGALLVLANPFLNRGSLFYVQERMGQDCKPFRAYKFRSMLAVSKISRGPFDALEKGRITWLGHILRKSRLDELPQLFNVLRGEMSLIGPRPDFYEHAKVYVTTVRGYRERHRVLPGISGLAQTEIGYVEGRDGLERKVAADLIYAAEACIRLDLWITWRTMLVVLQRKGA
ncbi:MAG: sugar transferase [Rhodobacteraceae bacterium]|nr:sugar transferase [Paracoccaceae bacterium]